MQRKIKIGCCCFLVDYKGELIICWYYNELDPAEQGWGRVIMKKREERTN